jgi:hypothetical protein
VRGDVHNLTHRRRGREEALDEEEAHHLHNGARVLLSQ